MIDFLVGFSTSEGPLIMGAFVLVTTRKGQYKILPLQSCVLFLFRQGRPCIRNFTLKEQCLTVFLHEHRTPFLPRPSFKLFHKSFCQHPFQTVLTSRLDSSNCGQPTAIEHLRKIGVSCIWYCKKAMILVELKNYSKQLKYSKPFGRLFGNVKHHSVL